MGALQAPSLVDYSDSSGARNYSGPRAHVLFASLVPGYRKLRRGSARSSRDAHASSLHRTLEGLSIRLPLDAAKPCLRRLRPFLP